MEQLFNMDRTPHTALTVTKQTSLNEEKITKNGVTQIIHVVVKNSPFQLTVKLSDSKPTNFNQLAFDIKLIYDMQQDEKEVSYVKVKPVEYKPMVNEAGDEINFDVKIKVLSSHHEDNHFILKITVWDPQNPAFMPLSSFSAPIKVISKPLKHRKRSSGTVTGQKRSRALTNTAAVSQTLEIVRRVEQQQAEGLRLLRQLSQQSGLPTQPQNVPNQVGMDLMSITSASPVMMERAAKRQKLEKQSTPKTFEGAMSAALQQYAKLSPTEKHERVRRLLRTIPLSDSDLLLEMVDLMMASGLAHRDNNRFLYGGTQGLDTMIKPDPSSHMPGLHGTFNTFSSDLFF